MFLRQIYLLNNIPETRLLMFFHNIVYSGDRAAFLYSEQCLMKPSRNST
jgi:hypothetical protein